MSASTMREVTGGLRFPEGPIAMGDGSVLVVEMRGGTLTRVTADGTKTVVAELGGGPNGAAIGPDGAVYICNNDGFLPEDAARRARGESSGSIQRVELATGAFMTLYAACDGVPLNAPNDLVFDTNGGFYFTDYGHRHDGAMDLGAVYYAHADGSQIRRVIAPLLTPNGVGLSPDGRRLYVAETQTGRVWAWAIEAPGVVREFETVLAPSGATLLAGLPGFQLFDSLAVDSAGNVCVGTLIEGGITVITPDGETRHVPIAGDPYVTNICFGGPERRTAYITASLSGRLLAMEWPVPGLPLAYEA
jgi:gluconolactonase